MVDVGKNVRNLIGDVESICRKYGKGEKEVTVLAATKSADIDMMEMAIRSGISVIGENRIQDAKKKFVHLSVDVRKHFIGHLQTNKVREAVELFDCIESVDSEKVLRMIDYEARRQSKTVDILIEVNISGEKSKFGVRAEDVEGLVKMSEVLRNIVVRGLMTLLPHGVADEEKVILFGKMKGLFDDLKLKFAKIDTLSMGMSEDFEMAIMTGSTEIRIGSLLFRDY